MSTEKAPISEYIEHIYYTTIIFFAIGFMKAMPEPRGTRMPVL